MSKEQLFDNDRLTELVTKYNKGGGEDKLLLGEILSETRALIAVVSAKFAVDPVLGDDLAQEARFHLITAVPKYNPDKGEKLYSFFSVVIRNAMIDFMRKQHPEYELTEYHAYEEPDNDFDYVTMLVNDMLTWFKGRFPTVVPQDSAAEVLTCVLMDLIDNGCGKRAAIQHLMDDYEMVRSDATIVYDAVTVKLRILMEHHAHQRIRVQERSLHPELIEATDVDDYRTIADVFSGMSLRFRKDGKNGNGST